jgi:hypothetical protein
MRRIRVRRPSPGLVIAVVALVLALGGGAYAAATITGADIRNGTITGKDIKNGSVPGAKKLKANSVTGRQVKESSLGQVPSAADADELGGQPPSAYASDWAVVAGTATGATVLASSEGVSATRIGAGVYAVDFGESVVRRPLTATLHPAAGPGFVTVAPCGGSANNPGGVNCPGNNDNDRVLVQTYSTAGAPADRAFYLVVGPR